MNPFVSWLIALVVGVVLAVVGLFIAAYVATYFTIWLAGVVLLLMFFGAIAGLYVLADKGGN